MEARLTGMNENEVLLYLGYHGGDIALEVRRQIHDGMDLMLRIARPRVTYRIFRRLSNGTLENTEFLPQGQDVRELLAACDRVVLFAATLGMEVEQFLRRKQVENMSEAVILDCCGSSAIENVCDNFCADLRAELAPCHLTDRFSPGYGDLPFAQQAEFCSVLDLPRRLGVTLSPGGLMIPQKSVTALMGIADTPQPRRFRGCAHCGQFENCTYRKGGKTCGNF